MFIRFGLILALASFCFTVFSPFINMMLWALILAVALSSLTSIFCRIVSGQTGTGVSGAGVVRYFTDRHPPRC
ncbi:hypothetical protein LNP17_06170 [Klebsiella variicola subsp. variicola]|nr:hypothetical protein [Klebsiella variicola subsp. variicola]